MSILQKSLHIDNAVVKNNLMSIANIVQECSLNVFAKNLDEIEVMLANVNANVIELV